MARPILPDLPAIAVLTPYVTRILGQNPGNFTLQGTNTYLVGHPQSRERILIDTTEANMPRYSELLVKFLNTGGLRLSAICLTHYHADHTGALPDVLRALGYKPPVYKYSHPEVWEGEGWLPLADNEILTHAGVRLRVVHSPGHTDDHSSFWLEDEHLLFTGDNVLGHGTTIFSNYIAYMNSLQRYLALPGLGRILPSHGQIIVDGPAKIREYIAHRQEREKQVAEVVRSFGKPVLSIDVTRKIYGDRPEEILYAADRGVQQYLEKLLQDGTVAAASGEWSIPAAPRL